MSPRKLTYQNWIVEIGFDPGRKGDISVGADRPRNERIIAAVREAVARLSPLEREFIERYYFCGQSCASIASALNKKEKRIEAIRRQAVIKLRKYLAGFVRKQFRIEVETGPDCPICNSPCKAEIDRLIKNKKKKETWKKIIKMLKEDYSVIIRTPQILISHQKYHMI
jgi:IS30 family transposase